MLCLPYNRCYMTENSRYDVKRQSINRLQQLDQNKIKKEQGIEGLAKIWKGQRYMYILGPPRVLVFTLKVWWKSRCRAMMNVFVEVLILIVIDYLCSDYCDVVKIVREFPQNTPYLSFLD